MSAFVPALAPFLIGSLLAFAPFPASFVAALVRLLFVLLLTFLLAFLAISSITTVYPLPQCGRIRGGKHPEAKHECQTNSKNC